MGSHPRVAYLLSAGLIEASDRLPSNKGRSKLVHSLAFHLGLLDGVEDEALAEGQEQAEGTQSLLELLLDHEEQPLSPRHDGSTKAKVYEPQAVPTERLLSYHTKAYVDALLSGISSGSEQDSETFGLLDDCPRFQGLEDYVKLVAGASITAAELLASDEADIAICWDGGRHHAHKARAAGFCYVNDVVLAIMELKRLRKITVPLNTTVDQQGEEQQQTNSSSSVSSPSLGFGARPEDIARAHAAGTAHAATRKGSSASTRDHQPRPAPRKRRIMMRRLERILYLDLDLHWGDGVEEAFIDSSSVLTLSIHNEAPGFYPVPPPPRTSESGHDADKDQERTYALRLPLQPGVGPATWRRIWKTCVEPVMEAYSPEAIVVQCGLDGLAGDAMDQWNLDLSTLLDSVQTVLDWARKAKAKVLLLGGGGYHSPNAARGWAAMTALALGRMDTSDKEAVQTQNELMRDQDDPDDVSSLGTTDTGTIPSDSEKHQDSASTPAPPTKEVACEPPPPTDRLHLSSAIPTTLSSWPDFGPTFTFDVAAGDRADVLHDEAYVGAIEGRFERVVRSLEKRKGSVCP
ncbi:unnamed protein product [Jaminaea pallidilutea]